MSNKHPGKRAEFVKLREAYELLSDIYEMGGLATKGAKGVKLGSIPRERWAEVSGRLRGCEELVQQLIEGPGEKRAMAGKEEVVVSCIEVQEGGLPVAIEICLLRVQGRSKVTSTLCTSTKSDDWREKVSEFADWDSVESVIAAADGNNQRAMIGLVFTLSGVGRGALSMTEVEIPQEIDEATHLVRGAEWMKAGLPRFRSAASEALWYLMRVRSVHSRVIRSKKQGLYTSMALTAMFAAGLSMEEVARASKLNEGLVKRLVYTSVDSKASDRDREFIRDFVFDDEEVVMERVNAAMRIWRGPAIYKRGMDWRIAVSRKAREALFEGRDLVEVSENFKIQRRELVRILSVSLAEMVFERDRFLCGVLSPQTVREVCGL